MTVATSDTWEDLSVVRCYYCSGTGKQGTDTCITCKGRGEYMRRKPVVEPRSAARERHLICWACLGARQCGACQGSRVKPDGTPCRTCDLTGICDECHGDGDLPEDDPTWTST